MLSPAFFGSSSASLVPSSGLLSTRECVERRERLFSSNLHLPLAKRVKDIEMADQCQRRAYFIQRLAACRLTATPSNRLLTPTLERIRQL